MRKAAWLLPLIALAACSRPHDAVIAQGTIEVEETDIVPTVRGRITRIWVAEGAQVHAGDTLVSLQAPTLPEDIMERQAQVSRAEAELRDLERGSRPEEIARAEAELRSAIAEDTRADKERERMDALVADKVVSQQDADNARAAAADAHGKREAAEQSLELLRQGPTREAREAARSRLAEARAYLAQGHATDGELTLLAPADGVVMPLYYRVGEVIESGDPVMTTADASRPWVRVFVNQRDVPSLRIGGSAQAVLDGVPEHPIPGQIVAINHEAEYIPRVALTTDERADLMFGIKVALSSGDGAARAGLPATVRLTRVATTGLAQVAEVRP
ncbi:MAG TPA: efflux RND transporter periplasmic adaptor subunit [Gemmatimonadales bacterium]|nr:efflux RND transporter periplasmic adaptor subunit [Gemmatimonadales bacterium]